MSGPVTRVGRTGLARHGSPAGARTGALNLLRICLFFCLIAIVLDPPDPAAASYVFKEWLPVGVNDWNANENPEIGINHAVILFDGHVIDDSNRSFRSFYSRYRRVRVFDAKGADDFRTVEIPYTRSWKFTRIMARTVKPSGEIIEVKEDDIHEKTLIKIGKHRVRSKVFAFMGVEPGDIVEYIYVMRSEGLAFPLVQLQTRTYAIETYLRWFNYPQPHKDEYINATPQELDFLTYRSAYVIPNGRAFGGVAAPVNPDSPDDGVEVRFQNLPGIPDEPYMPADQAVAVLFAGYYEWPRREAKQPFWDRIAVAYGSSTREFISDSKKLDAWMKEITDRPRSLDDDLTACVDFVQREIRNADILEEDELPKEVPESRNVDELIENKIGNGEQLDYLVTAMLRKLGYQATVFWARDQEDGPFIPDWKSADQFSICGVAVRRDVNRIVFCVPHITAAAATTRPWEICGSKALMENVSEARSFADFPALCDIPLAEEEGNTTRLEIVLHEGEEGKLVGRLTKRWECAHETFFLQSLSNTLRKDRKGAIARLKGLALRPELEWTALDESLSVGRESVAYSCSLEVEGLVEQAGSMSLVDLGALRVDDYFLPDDIRRTNLDFHHASRQVSEIVLTLPPDREAVDPPAPVQLKDRLTEFQASVSADSSGVRLHRDVRIHHGLFLPAAAEPLRAFFRKVAKAHEQPIVIRARGSR